MNTKNQKPSLRSKIQSASFLIWVISGFYLLAMTWLLLSARGVYGTNDMQPWLASAAAAATVAYGILMLLLLLLIWQNEERRGNRLSR
jgi:apolipoprotein N-acyltransferase